MARIAKNLFDALASWQKWILAGGIRILGKFRCSPNGFRASSPVLNPARHGAVLWQLTQQHEPFRQLICRQVNRSRCSAWAHGMGEDKHQKQEEIQLLGR